VPDQGYKSPTAFRLRTTLLSALRPCPRGYAADHDAGAYVVPSPATAGLTQQAPLVNVMWCSDACIFLSSHSAEGEVKDATWLAKVLGRRLRSWAPRTWCSW
jgi:hypothetical protein